jgi:hypothetical protein
VGTDVISRGGGQVSESDVVMGVVGSAAISGGLAVLHPKMSTHSADNKSRIDPFIMRRVWTRAANRFVIDPPIIAKEYLGVTPLKYGPSHGFASTCRTSNGGVGRRNGNGAVTAAG